MLPGFFDALPFQDKVLKCISRLKAIKADQVDKSPDFHKLVDELKSHMKDAQFKTLAQKLQEEVQQTIERTSKNIMADGPAAMATTAAAGAGVATGCVIQIPSQAHIKQMVQMPAGGKEDQCKRLTHMVQTINAVNDQFPLPLMTSDKVNLGAEWNALFTAISKGEKDKAITLFRAIPAANWLLKSLLTVHTPPYLEHIVGQCLKAVALSTADKPGVVEETPDLKFTPKTFELLIYDIATTLQSPAKVTFSFGLPSHHAFSDMGSGFCILNKTAVVIGHLETIKPKSLHYVIVGTDVNRDNGLCDILMRTSSPLHLSHIDLFDSRVFPSHNAATISKLIGSQGNAIEKSQVKYWQHNKLTYYAVDLSLVTRTNKARIHPALAFALRKIKETIAAAQKSGQKVMILLPTGWDSHEDETASCGKWVNGKMMEKAEASKTRFNDADLTFFYKQIFAIYKQNTAFIEGIYWGLEGGYNKSMYEQQIKLMLEVIAKDLLPAAAPASTAAHAGAPVMAPPDVVMKF